MKLVNIEHATRKNLDEMCRTLNMSKEHFDIMKRWYYSSTEVWAGFWQEELACLYGLWSVSIMSDEAYLWLVTNDLVKEHPFLFVRHSQLIVQAMLKEFSTINGHVHAGSPNSIQWLEWLGVKLRRHEVDKGLIPFELKRSA
jgi:hypothetical protein